MSCSPGVQRWREPGGLSWGIGQSVRRCEQTERCQGKQRSEHRGKWAGRAERPPWGDAGEGVLTVGAKEDRVKALRGVGRVRAPPSLLGQLSGSLLPQLPHRAGSALVLAAMTVSPTEMKDQR